MRIALSALAAFCFLSAAAALAQKPKPNQQKKEGDLPDVSLLIPEDARPETKAIIKANAIALGSKKASERMKAAQVLGELREQGKPVRGLLCRAMLDSSSGVRIAAADALKAIDPKMQFLAVALLSEESDSRRRRLLEQIQKLESDGEPLAPLIASSAIERANAPRPDNSLLIEEFTTLSYIAKNDLPTCKLIASALDSGSVGMRLAATRAMARMKHGKLAIKKLMSLAKADETPNRIAAIQSLAVLADESTEEIVTAAIASQRYHKDENVRRAVETALNRIQGGANPKDGENP